MQARDEENHSALGGSLRLLVNAREAGRGFWDAKGPGLAELEPLRMCPGARQQGALTTQGPSRLDTAGKGEAGGYERRRKWEERLVWVPQKVLECLRAARTRLGAQHRTLGRGLVGERGSAYCSLCAG